MSFKIDGVTTGEIDNIFYPSGNADFIFSNWDNTLGYSEKMRITGTGNIGIGTNSPTSKLHIYNDDNNALSFRIDNPNANGSSKLYFDGSNHAGIAVFGSSYSGSENVMRIFNNRNSPDGTIDFVLNGGKKMVITETGAVGIGVSNPVATLEVDGKIKIGTDGSSPEAGQIRFLNGHFEGYNGTTWVQLDN